MADTDPTLTAEGTDTREDERPAWLPEKYATPEDLARAHTEAERKIHELATQNKGLEESISELTSQWDQFLAEQQKPDPNQVQEQLLAMYEQNPVATMAQIARETAQQVLSQYGQQAQQPQTDPNVIAYIADQNMAAQYPDWSQVKERVADIVKSDPVFQNDALWNTPAAATAALDRAYRLEKAEGALAAEAEQRQLQVGRTVKLAAQTATGATGRPDNSPDDATKRWEEIMAADRGRLKF